MIKHKDAIMKTIHGDINLETLSDFNGWYQGGMNLINYAGMELTPDLSIAVIDLFFPQFVLHRGTILLHHRLNEEIFDEWFRYFEGDLTQVERFLNTVRVRDLFSNIKFEGHPYQNIEYIGKCLKKAWIFEFSQQFPDNNIEVIGYRSEPNDDYVIAFWQKR